MITLPELFFGLAVGMAGVATLIVVIAALFGAR